MKEFDRAGVSQAIARKDWDSLRDYDLRRADLGGEDLRGAYLRGVCLQGTYLLGTDLRGVDLLGADLRGANLDYASWPLWCGSLDVMVDKQIATQLAYHFCRLACDDPGYIAARNAIVDFANQFRRAERLGRLQKIEVIDDE